MNRNILKRTLAGVLAVLTVAAAVPAEVTWSELVGGTAVVASADTDISSETIATTSGDRKSDQTYNGTGCTVSGYLWDNSGLAVGKAQNGQRSITITENTDYRITKVEFTLAWIGSGFSFDKLNTSVGQLSCDIFEVDGKVTVDNIAADATEITLSAPQSNMPVQFSSVMVYYGTGPYVTAAPTADDNLTYNGEEQTLLSDGGTVSAADQGASMKYGTPKDGERLIKQQPEKLLQLSADNIRVGDICVPTDTNGMFFPGDYHVKLGDTELQQYSGEPGIKLLRDSDSSVFISGKISNDDKKRISGKYLTTGCDAVKIKSIDTENKLIEVEELNVPSSLEWSFDIPKGVDAGEYCIYYKAVQEGKPESDVGTVTASIAPAELTLNGAEGLTYTGEPLCLVDGDIPEGTKFSLTEPQILDFDEEGEKLEPMLNATYEKLSILSSGSTEYNYFYNLLNSLNYYYSAISELKEGSTANLSYNIEWATYHADTLAGIEYTPDAEFSEAEEYVYTYIKDKTGDDLIDRFTDKTDWKDTAEATDAGKYTVWYKGSGNYTDTVKSFDVTITAASDYTAPKANTLKYNGKEQALVTEGSTGYGTMEYCVLPKGGEMVVYDTDERSLEDSDMVEGKIFKPGTSEGFNLAGSIVEFKDKCFTGGAKLYVDEQGKCVLSGRVVGEGEKTIPLGDDFNALKIDEILHDDVSYDLVVSGVKVPDIDWSESVPTGKDVGVYDVYYRVKGNKNVKDVAPTLIQVTIGKGDIVVTPPTANKLTYNGKAQELIKAGKSSAGTMAYAIGGKDKAPNDFSAAIPTATKAGEYYVWYMASGDDNYVPTTPQCIKVTIAEKAEPAPTAAKISIKKAKIKVNNKTYTGNALKPGSKVVLGGKRLKRGTDYTITFKKNKNVGIATAVIKGKGNYTGSATVHFNVKPKKVNLKSVTSPKARKLQVKWGKVTQATGYNIKVATSKSFKKKTLVRNVYAKKNATVSKRFAKIKSGKTYYVKIRAYKQTKSGKIYGQYSAVKSVKVK